jgi:hypothetical protein
MRIEKPPGNFPGAFYLLTTFDRNEKGISFKTAGIILLRSNSGAGYSPA